MYSWPFFVPHPDRYIIHRKLGLIQLMRVRLVPLAPELAMLDSEFGNRGTIGLIHDDGDVIVVGKDMPPRGRPALDLCLVVRYWQVHDGKQRGSVA